MPDTLYKRLGGYDAIAAVCDDLLPRLMGDAGLARFWQNRAEDSLRREKHRLLPDGANRRVGLAPTGKRCLFTAHAISRRPSRLNGSVQSNLSAVTIGWGNTGLGARTGSGWWTPFGASVKSAVAVRQAPTGRSP